MRFKKHIFVCENKRDKNHLRGCCSDKHSPEIRQLFKAKLKSKNLNVKFRANTAGCLDACEYGAAVVIYPDQIWYGGVSENDVDEIIESHLINNIPVERLMINDKRFTNHYE